MDRTNNLKFLSELLHELCRLPEETEWAEFKSNLVNPEEIGEYISALANSAALFGKTNAYLVWGVNDENHELIGTTFHPSKTKIGNEELESWLLRFLHRHINFRFIEFVTEDKHFTLLEIPCAAHEPVQFKGVKYIRIGSYKKKLKDYPEKERELWRTFDVTPFEYQVARDRVGDTDVLKLLDYPAYFKLLDLPLPETRKGILDCLADERMIESDQSGRWNILNMGAVLFASDISVFSRIARKAVRVIEYNGRNRVNTKREYLGRTGYAAGFEELISSLKSMLPENEVIGEAFRKSMPMYPEVAIRELVANMIIHQDFSVTGSGPMIEVFDGWMEITNPGIPLMDTKRFLDTPPRSRNEVLASFLRRAGICEERGSGIDKVVFQTEIYQLPAPLFEVTVGHTRAILFAHKTFPNMGRDDRIRACYLHACLQYVQRNSLTNSSLRHRFGIEEQNRAQVSRVISETKDAGLIRNTDPESGSRKHVSYVPFWA